MRKSGIAGILMLWLTGICSVYGGTASDSTYWSHIPHNQTFDVVTWNIEWFGDETRGPSDTELQYRNVVEIIDSLKPDLIGVQEIYSVAQFNRLIDDLEDYDGFVTRYGWSGDPDAGLDVGFIYKTRTVHPIQYRVLDHNSQANLTPYYWANRLPKEFIFQVNFDDVSFSARAVVIHAKARSDKTSYERRTDASREIKNNYFEPFLSNIPLIFLGDYNDNMIESIYRPNGNAMPSPYRNFVDDPAYEVVTYSLEEAGEASWPGVDSRFDASMLDHITINEPFFDFWLRGSERVYRPEYIHDYPRTTSDHYPVKVRFDLIGSATAAEYSGSGKQDNSQHNTPQKTKLHQNYPNPFNPATIIPFHLETDGLVTITIYNSIGRQVARPVADRRYQAGSHSVRFDARDLPGGLYFYQLKDGSGWSRTRKMILMK